MTFYDKVKESSDYVKSRMNQKPTISIVLGSGLGSLVEVRAKNLRHRMN